MIFSYVTITSDVKFKLNGEIKMYSAENKESVSYNDFTVTANELSSMRHQVSTDKIFTNYQDYEVVKILSDSGERTIFRNIKKNIQSRIDRIFDNYQEYQILTKLDDSGERVVAEKAKRSSFQNNVDKLFSNFGNYAVMKGLTDQGETVMVKNKKYIKQFKIDNLFETHKVVF